MAFWDNIRFPYFNMQELNLDWILSKIKDILGFIPENGAVGQILRRTADGAEWSDEATPVVPVTSVNNKTGDVIVPYTNPNLLDNWYFIGGGSQLGAGYFPVNQKGQTTYTGSGVTIDRWYNDNLSSVQIHADGVGFYGTGSTSDASQMLNNDELHGLTLTCSVWDSTNHLTIGTTTFPDKPASGWNYKNIISADTFNIVLGAKSDGESRLFIQPKNSASVILKAIKLELGTYQTMMHTENGALVFNEAPNYAAEILKCLRYQINLNPSTIFYGVIGYAFGVSATEIDMLITTPCEMARSVTFEGYANLILSDMDYTNPINPTAASCTRMGNGIKVVFTVTGATANKLYIAHVGTSTSSFMLSSAQ